MTTKFYVQSITKRGQIIGYGIYDNVGGMVSEHFRYMVEVETTIKEALKLAEAHCRYLNGKQAVRS